MMRSKEQYGVTGDLHALSKVKHQERDSEIMESKRRKNPKARITTEDLINETARRIEGRKN
jgi:hypothetical protein